MKTLLLVLTIALTLPGFAEGQSRRRGQNRERIGDSNPLPIGNSGVAWYTTWKSGLEEAKRSNRPIFFMTAATTCSGVPGVFWPGYTKTQNSLFSTPEFIKASRKFVCIRIETYENKESEKLVKKVLNGRMANTAFTILNPQGNKMLTIGSRSPGMSMSADGGRTDTSGKENPEIIAKMDRIAKSYQPKSKSENSLLQDFHSFRQALNCAAADQRLLVVVNASQKQEKAIQTKLRHVFSTKAVVGKFHLDFVSKPEDKTWHKSISNAKDTPGLFIIQADQYGQKGKSLAQVNLSSSETEIKKALAESNATFAKTEKRKHYESHVAKGRRQGISFENEISRGDSSRRIGDPRRRPSRRRNRQ